MFNKITNSIFHLCLGAFIGINTAEYLLDAKRDEDCPYANQIHSEIKCSLYYMNNENICRTDSMIYEIDFKAISTYSCN